MWLALCPSVRIGTREVSLYVSRKWTGFKWLNEDLSGVFLYTLVKALAFHNTGYFGQTNGWTAHGILYSVLTSAYKHRRNLRRFRKICEKRLLASSCLFVRSHGTTNLPLHAIFMKFDTWVFFFRKSVEKIQVSFKPEKNNKQFRWKAVYFYDNTLLSSS